MKEVDETTPEEQSALYVRLPSSLHKKFKAHCVMEGVDMEYLIQQYIKKELKDKGDGNPAYTIDHFTDEKFLATPALARPVSVWRYFLLKCPESVFKETEEHIFKLNHVYNQVFKERKK